MDVIFTDLDGTLLDRETYSWAAAEPALARLRRDGIPWILVTSKTRSEVELWRTRLRNEHPFIVENGAAAFVPPGYYRHDSRPGPQTGGYRVLRWGTRYAELVRDLRDASRAAKCRIRGISDMSTGEVARLCGMPFAEAVLAKQREYGEPFLILDQDRTHDLLAAIRRRGRNCQRGGRFWHITGASDKGVAVRALSALFAREYGCVRTIGAGDGPNDLPFLRVVDRPLVIRSRDMAELRTPGATVSPRRGPEGWNAAILELIGSSRCSSCCS